MLDILLLSGRILAIEDHLHRVDYNIRVVMECLYTRAHFACPHGDVRDICRLRNALPDMLSNFNLLLQRVIVSNPKSIVDSGSRFPSTTLALTSPASLSCICDNESIAHNKCTSEMCVSRFQDLKTRKSLADSVTLIVIHGLLAAGLEYNQNSTQYPTETLYQTRSPYPTDTCLRFCRFFILANA